MVQFYPIHGHVVTCRGVAECVTVSQSGTYMPQKVTRRRQTPRPERVHDAITRGLMLRHLLDTAGWTVSAFAEITGIPRNTVTRWINGQTDLAHAQHANAHALIRGLGRSNDEVWALFAIPEDLRMEFKADDAAALTIEGSCLTLGGPLYGEMNVPAGATVRYAPGGLGEFTLVRLADGTYYAVRSLVDLRDAQVLGSLLGVSFGAPQSTPALSPAAFQN